MRQLMDLVAKNSYKLPDFVQALGPLTRYAVIERYTIGRSAPLDRAAMLSLVEQCRDWVKEELA